MTHNIRFDSLQAPLKEGEDSVNDRSLVIFDENSRRFTTGRNHPKLVLIRVVSYDNVQVSKNTSTY